MVKADVPGKQPDREPASPFLENRAVLRVPPNRKTGVGQLYSNLVVAPGVKGDLQEAQGTPLGMVNGLKDAIG